MSEVLRDRLCWDGEDFIEPFRSMPSANGELLGLATEGKKICQQCPGLEQCSHDVDKLPRALRRWYNDPDDFPRVVGARLVINRTAIDIPDDEPAPEPASQDDSSASEGAAPRPDYDAQIPMDNTVDDGDRQTLDDIARGFFGDEIVAIRSVGVGVLRLLATDSRFPEPVRAAAAFAADSGAISASLRGIFPKRVASKLARRRDDDPEQCREGAMEDDWQEWANCRGVDPELFFPERGESTREAKEVCRGCAVRQDCLEYALGVPEKFGRWGGLSELERRRIRRQRAKATRPKQETPNFGVAGD
jgi:WhiB family redox-sensing transcriptional regulator